MESVVFLACIQNGSKILPIPWWFGKDVGKTCAVSFPGKVEDGSCSTYVTEKLNAELLDFLFSSFLGSWTQSGGGHQVRRLLLLLLLLRAVGHLATLGQQVLVLLLVTLLPDPGLHPAEEERPPAVRTGVLALRAGAVRPGLQGQAHILPRGGGRGRGPTVS